MDEDIEESIFQEAPASADLNESPDFQDNDIADEGENEIRVDVLSAKFGGCGRTEQQSLLSQMAVVSQVCPSPRQHTFAHYRLGITRYDCCFA
jgi:hypothetical protein